MPWDDDKWGTLAGDIADQDDLTTALAGKAGTDHDSTHVSGGSDEIAGESLAVTHSPSNYTASAATLAGHLSGVDAALSLTDGQIAFGGASNTIDSDANLAWANTDKTLTVKGSTADGSTDILALSDSEGNEEFSVDSAGVVRVGNIDYDYAKLAVESDATADPLYGLYVFKESESLATSALLKINSQLDTRYGLRVVNSGNDEVLSVRADGRVGIYIRDPDSELHVNGALTLSEKSADPSDPAEGTCVIWLSDGTGTGDDGDVLIKVTAGGSTKTATLVDFSEV